MKAAGECPPLFHCPSGLVAWLALRRRALPRLPPAEISEKTLRRAGVQYRGTHWIRQGSSC